MAHAIIAAPRVEPDCDKTMTLLHEIALMSNSYLAHFNFTNFMLRQG